MWRQLHHHGSKSLDLEDNSRSGVGRGGLSRCHKISPGGVTNAWKTAGLPEDFRASSEDSACRLCPETCGTCIQLCWCTPISHKVRMSLLSRRRVLQATAGAVAAASPCGATAEEYPSRPIRLVIPYAAGGSGDQIGRPWAERMASCWDRPMSRISAARAARSLLSGRAKRAGWLFFPSRQWQHESHCPADFNKSVLRYRPRFSGHLSSDHQRPCIRGSPCAAVQ
jgi:hypothetical protein